MLLTHASLNYLNTLSPFFFYQSFVKHKFLLVITSLNSQVTGIKFYTIEIFFIHNCPLKKEKEKRKTGSKLMCMQHSSVMEVLNITTSAACFLS